MKALALQLWPKFWRVFLTSGTAALSDVAGFVALLALGVAPAPAASGSLAAAVALNYVLTARYAYRQRLGWRPFARFCSTQAIGIAINIAVTLSALEAGLAPALAKTLGLGIAFGLNFLLGYFFVFATPRGAGRSDG